MLSLPLPAGWTSATAPNGKEYFINHATKQTQWNDPRDTAPPPRYTVVQDHRKHHQHHHQPQHQHQHQHHQQYPAQQQQFYAPQQFPAGQPQQQSLSVQCGACRTTLLAPSGVPQFACPVCRAILRVQVPQQTMQYTQTGAGVSKEGIGSSTYDQQIQAQMLRLQIHHNQNNSNGLQPQQPLPQSVIQQQEPITRKVTCPACRKVLDVSLPSGLVATKFNCPACRILIELPPMIGPSLSLPGTPGGVTSPTNSPGLRQQQSLPPMSPGGAVQGQMGGHPPHTRPMNSPHLIISPANSNPSRLQMPGSPAGPSPQSQSQAQPQGVQQGGQQGGQQGSQQGPAQGQGQGGLPSQSPSLNSAPSSKSSSPELSSAPQSPSQPVTGSGGPAAGLSSPGSTLATPSSSNSGSSSGFLSKLGFGKKSPATTPRAGDPKDKDKEKEKDKKKKDKDKDKKGVESATKVECAGCSKLIPAPTATQFRCPHCGCTLKYGGPPPPESHGGAPVKIYGSALSQICTEHFVKGPGGETKTVTLPRSITALAQYLLEKCNSVEGIFRVPGESQEVKDLVVAIDKLEVAQSTYSALKAKSQGTKDELWVVGANDMTAVVNEAAAALNLSQYLPHSVAGAYKQFWRDLAEPVLTYRLYDPIIACAKDPEHLLQTVYSSRDGVGEPNQSVLVTLCEFLFTISTHSQKNFMTTSNLAVVFAPNLLQPPTPSIETMTQHAKPAIEVVDHLICSWNKGKGLEELQGEEEGEEGEGGDEGFEGPSINGRVSVSMSTSKVYKFDERDHRDMDIL